jgi:hypothetical protein
MTFAADWGRQADECGHECGCRDLCPFGENKAEWARDDYERASAQEADNRAEREARW